MIYKRPFEITQCWTNGMMTLQNVVKKFGYIIFCINPYTSVTNLEDIKC